MLIKIIRYQQLYSNFSSLVFPFPSPLSSSFPNVHFLGILSFRNHVTLDGLSKLLGHPVYFCHIVRVERPILFSMAPTGFPLSGYILRVWIS